MMKCLQRVEEEARKHGASIDWENTDPERGGCCIIVDAPRGYVWYCNDCSAIYHFGVWQESAFWTEAARDAIRDIRGGVRRCTPEEAADIEYDRGLPAGSWSSGWKEQEVNS